MSTTQIDNAINTANSISSAASSNSSTSNLSVDTDTFLKLLVAQLANQDPLNPQEDTEFVTQLAQMTTLEEMQQIGAGMSSIQAYSFVGKYAYAEATDPETGITGYYCGTIDSIVSESGTYYAIIGEDAVKVDDIVQVFDPDMLETGTTLIGTSDLLGKIVTGWYSSDGTGVEVTGIVSGVTYDNGAVYAIVDGIGIAVDSITDISEQTQIEQDATEQDATEQDATEQDATE